MSATEEWLEETRPRSFIHAKLKKALEGARRRVVQAQRQAEAMEKRCEEFTALTEKEGTTKADLAEWFYDSGAWDASCDYTVEPWEVEDE